MNMFTKSETLLYFVLSVLVYVGLNALLPASLLINLLNALFFSVSVIVLVAITPMIVKALRAEQFDRLAQLSVGIYITWLALFLARLNSVLFRALHNAQWVTNSPVTSFSAYMGILGGVLYIVVPGIFDINSKQKRSLLVFSISIGIILGVFIFLIEAKSGS